MASTISLEKSLLNEVSHIMGNEGLMEQTISERAIQKLHGMPC